LPGVQVVPPINRGDEVRIIRGCVRHATVVLADNEPPVRVGAHTGKPCCWRVVLRPGPAEHTVGLRAERRRAKQRGRLVSR
ncbi:hypothetical protein ACP3WY_24780, partial [Salmonella enterica]|uniref:hypothetical protein n=1 Tax=Salmonella enterica TaxID=28901 RepID=UPI003CF5AE81